MDTVFVEVPNGETEETLHARCLESVTIFEILVERLSQLNYPNEELHQLLDEAYHRV